MCGNAHSGWRFGAASKTAGGDLPKREQGGFLAFALHFSKPLIKPHGWDRPHGVGQVLADENQGSAPDGEMWQR